MKQTMSIDEIENNWNVFQKLCNKAVKDGMDELLESLGERLSTCPASSRLDQYSAYPGGLVQHSLDVTSTMSKINQSHELGLEMPSILRAGLLHDIGKVGSIESDYFVPQNSDWHREKLGQMFKFNDDLNRMSTSHRSLCLLQEFGITLSPNEWVAIQLAAGSHFEENRFYVGHEPTLALTLQNAKAMVIHKFKIGNS